ncbi:hypothetical protein P4O66_004849 [Electrophorus voltai]|uniref:VASt domain-containing protein n=1 Tax=Electrophorus voltai TaxID=2609070 RepID=A0AAD8ZXI6_9TELE|nr:hypothetical protein P4O66_004849 [Electrophorus voltai]
MDNTTPTVHIIRKGGRKMTHRAKPVMGGDVTVENGATEGRLNSEEHEVDNIKHEMNDTRQEVNNTRQEVNNTRQEVNNTRQEGDITGQYIGPLQAPPTSYKQRREEFRKTFKELVESERLIVDYACALQKDILLHGRLYLTESYLCFYSNIFWVTKITVKLRDIASMSREKTARWIPNAIQIYTNTEKSPTALDVLHIIFCKREKFPEHLSLMAELTDGEVRAPTAVVTAQGLLSFTEALRQFAKDFFFKVAALFQLTRHELLQMVKQHYGNDLGLSHEEMESLQGSADTVVHSQPSLNMKGEDHSRRLERPSSLRLPHTEQASQEMSTPQGDDTQSSIVQQSTPSANGEDSRSTPSCHRSPALPLHRFAPERTSKCSSLSLDLNANESRLSDSSLSGSMEEVERECASRGSQGRLYVNRVFRIRAEKMFELLFTDSYFFRRFMDVRKITGCTSTSWQRETSGSMKRSRNYTITINNPLVGKFSTATENQTLYKESREGHYYIVDAEVYTHDVPYHDYFYTVNRYCIIRTSKHKCRLRIYTDVKYNKQPWGFVKSFITKNSWSGLEDYFRHLEAELLEEEVELTQGSGDGGKGGLRRRRRTFSRTLQDHARPSRQYSADLEQRRDSTMGNDLWPIRVKILALRSLLSRCSKYKECTKLEHHIHYRWNEFNLWAMEDVAHRMYLSTKQRMRERAEASLAPDLGPRQSVLHQSHDEARLLRAVLQDSINLLEQLRSSLLELQRSFLGRNKTSSHL